MQLRDNYYSHEAEGQRCEIVEPPTAREHGSYVAYQVFSGVNSSSKGLSNLCPSSASTANLPSGFIHREQTDLVFPVYTLCARGLD